MATRPDAAARVRERELPQEDARDCRRGVVRALQGADQEEAGADAASAAARAAEDRGREGDVLTARQGRRKEEERERKRQR